MSFIDQILGMSQPASAQSAPMGTPMSTPLTVRGGQDPYAAIRNLQPVMGADTVIEGDSGSYVNPGMLGLDLNALEGTPFASKYNSLVPGPDGSLLATFQRPGGQKHQTFSVLYRKGPDGQWVMDESTIQEQQEKSGARQFWRSVGEGALVAGAGYLGGTALSSYAAGGGAGGLSGMDIAADAGMGSMGSAGAAPAGAAPAGAAPAAGTGGLQTASGAELLTGTTPLTGGGSTANTLPSVGTMTGSTGGTTAGATSYAVPAWSGGGIGGVGGSAAPAAAGAGGSYWDAAQGFMNIAGGIYGMRQADKAAERMDPFGPYRARYAQLLQQLEENPNAVSNLPGFRAGLRALESSTAAGGYFGSGNAAAALTEFGGNFYQQELDRLARLAGAGGQPGAGALGAADLTGRSMASIGYGIGQFGKFMGG